MAQIPVSRLGFRPQDGFGPQDWDLGLKAGIWALRLRYGPGGWGRGMEGKKEKIPLCESIDHQPLRGRSSAPSLNYNHDLPKQGSGTAFATIH